MIGVNVKGPKDWNKMKPPPGYIPGLGRGAVGFTTRSDIGSMASGTKPAGGAAAGGNNASGSSGGPVDMSESNFDQWGGYGGEKLFGDTPYEADDAEADQIYQAVDEYMDQRRKRRREEKEKERMKEERAKVPRIADQFADVKDDLAKVSQEEWEAIPETGDHSLKYKQQNQNQSHMPVPDDVIEMRKGSSHTTQIDANQPGASTSSGTGEASTAGNVTDISGFSEARGQVLGLRLDRMSDSVSGQTVVDPKGYLTNLHGLNSDAPDIDDTDIKKGRLLMKSLTSTNPKHAPAWIAACRFEEAAKKLPAARKIIKQGCEYCPTDEDIWLEAARLYSPTDARKILANAVKKIPNSVKLWIKAADLEETTQNKKAVLRRGLECVPHSVRLWKAAVELEEEEDARIMLQRAVECVPKSVELWLALARLETYENARKVLNEARKANPTEPSIWIAAAKLEEAQGNSGNVDKIIKKAVGALKEQQVIVDRSTWLEHAEQAEKANFMLTCSAIIRFTIGMGVEPEDRRRTWLEDAESFEEKGYIQCARATYAHMLEYYSDRKKVWLRAATLEKKHGNHEQLEQILNNAVKYCPKAEVLWLMAAKEKWVTQGDVEKAREILKDASSHNPKSEEILLACVKLEWENNNDELAREFLKFGTETCPTPRVWMKYALLEREAAYSNRPGSNPEKEKELLEQGLRCYSDFDKLWLMLGQYFRRNKEIENARKTYQQALKKCPQSIPLWISSARLEEQSTSVTKARSVLERGREENPAEPELWVEAIRLEARAGNEKLVENTVAKALQSCPNSGLVWAEHIARQPKSGQKRASQDAVKKLDSDPHVIVQVARFFWRERRYEKVRRWMNRAVALDPDIGDSWAWFYKFELEHGNEEQQKDVLKRCNEASPRYGHMWTKVSKAIMARSMTTEQILRDVVKMLPAPSEPLNE